MPGGLKMPEKQCNRAVCLFPQQLHCVAAVIGRPCSPRSNGPPQGMVAGKRQAMGWWLTGGTAAGRMADMALSCGCTRAINGQGHHNRMALLNVGWQPGEALDCQLRLPQREASGRQGPPVGAETSPPSLKHRGPPHKPPQAFVTKLRQTLGCLLYSAHTVGVRL